jgi:general secretion pathway protein K
MQPFVKRKPLAHPKVTQQGAALLTVMLIFFVASYLAIEMIDRQFLEIKRTGNMIDTDQAYIYTRSAENLAMAALAADTKQDKLLYQRSVDFKQEHWAKGVRFPLEEGRGTISAVVSDLQGRFNLNDLVLAEDPRLARQHFIDLLSSLGIPKEGNAIEIAESVLEWIDNDVTPNSSGVEDDYYLGLKQPYRTSSTLMVDLSELLLIKGVTKQEFQRLRDHICVLPKSVPINLNTASSVILQVMGVELEKLVERREEKNEPFKDEKSALEGQPPAVKNLLKKNRFSVSSQFYELSVAVNLDQKQAYLNTVIYRPDINEKSATFQVISRNRLAREIMTDVMFGQSKAEAAETQK